MGVLSMVRKAPEKSMKYFVVNQDAVTAEDIIKLFPPQFSDVGSNRFDDEQAVAQTWNIFLQSAERESNILVFTMRTSPSFLFKCSLSMLIAVSS